MSSSVIADGWRTNVTAIACAIDKIENRDCRVRSAGGVRIGVRWSQNGSGAANQQEKRDPVKRCNKRESQSVCFHDLSSLPRVLTERQAAVPGFRLVKNPKQFSLVFDE